MNRFLSFDSFIQAEKTAINKDLHISEALGEFYSAKGEICCPDECEVFKLVRPRPENSHKGSFGRLVLIVGSGCFPGAAQISALSALRSGAGLVQVITTKGAAAALAVNAKEATLLPVSSDGRGFIKMTPAEREDATESISKADAVLIGCGLGTGEGCAEILEETVNCAECPIIFDADGINLVCRRIELLRKAKADTILTPHPAELARLCCVPVGEAVQDRLSLAKKFAEENRCTLVSKSAATLIFSGGRVTLSARGNNALSKGGSGDFLAGLIASFAAQGYAPYEAALLGVTVQGMACEAVSEEFSRRAVLVSDMINALPALFKKIERLI